MEDIPLGVPAAPGASRAQTADSFLRGNNGANGAHATLEVEYPWDKHLMAGNERSYSYEGPTRYNRSRPEPVDPAEPSACSNAHAVEPEAVWYHAAWHTVTAVVGAGVLGLPYAFRWLGWAGGMISLVTACAVSYYTSYQLAELHHYNNKRHNRYRDLGKAIMGPRLGFWMIVPFQVGVMVGLAITYTVTAGQSIRAITQDVCFTDPQQCDAGLTTWIFIFGAAEVLLSQLPNFHGLRWVSFLGATTSCLYCMIAAFASAAKIGDTDKTPYDGDGVVSSADEVFSIFSAMGAITFAYGGHSVLLEIQATLADPPRAMKSMMKGISVAYVVVVLAYFLVSSLGYAAFGTGVDPNVLLSIDSPRWIVDIANVCVVIHVAASYQVFSMPLFEGWETYISQKEWKVSRMPWLVRFIGRSVYVILVTIVAATFPFFQDLMGLIGAIGFLPMTFICPAILWLVARRTNVFEKLVCWAIIVVFSIVALLSFTGAMRNIIVRASNYTFWS